MAEFNPQIKFKAQPVRLTFYAVFFSLMLFLMLPLSRMFQDYIEPKDVVRSIELATTPPPPPREQQQEDDVVVEQIVNIERQKTEIEIEPLDVQLDVSLEGDLKVQIDVGDFDVSQADTGILTDIKMFSLNELDQTPLPQNEPLFQVPAKLKSKTGELLVAETLVTLDEEGNVQLDWIISLSHPDARKELEEYLRKLRFSPPTKDGEPARVQFKLPIRLRIQ